MFRTLPESAVQMAPPRAWSKAAHSILLVWLPPGASARPSVVSLAAEREPQPDFQYELQMVTHAQQKSEGQGAARQGTAQWTEAPGAAPSGSGDGDWECVYCGKELRYEATQLQPATKHSYRLRAEVSTICSQLRASDLKWFGGGGGVVLCLC